MSNNAHIYHLKSEKLYDLYYCDGTDSDTAIIYCHGGAFRYGDKGDNRDFLAALAEKLSMRVYSVGYRNLDEARSIINMIKDIRESIESIVKEDSISHFHIMGASSGAYLVWILTIMASNTEKFNVSFDYMVDSVTLISGYLLFKKVDPITRMLCLFPSFQGFPQDIKRVDMDYSGYNLPPVLLITGKDDGCLEDSKVLYETVKKTNRTKIELRVINSQTDKADHCFISKRPYTEESKQAYEYMHSFIKEVM